MKKNQLIDIIAKFSPRFYRVVKNLYKMTNMSFKRIDVAIQNITK